MDRTRIMEILSDWNLWGDYDSILHSRPLYLKRIEELFSRKYALILLGIRRAGKSSLAELFIKDLAEKRIITDKDTLLINLEDPRFPPIIDSELLFKIYETYLAEIGPTDPIIILDEVQKVHDWERFARYLLESRKQRVIVTGSSSKVLDSEVSDILTGRHVDIEVTPLALREILDFNDIELDDLKLFKERNIIQKIFFDYCIWGGFPEVVLSGSEVVKKELLNTYFHDILIKDVVKRFNISDIPKLESLAHLYITQISDLISFNKLKDRLKMSLDTIENYSKYMEKARLFFFLDKFDWSRWKQIRSQKKVYVSDIGFHTLKGFKFSENRGKVMENIVAIELMRKRSDGFELYYWRDYQDHEIDFVVKKGNRIEKLIQVTSVSSIEDVNMREHRSLLIGKKMTDCHDLIIITDDAEGEVEMKDARIRLVPLWKWLLEG